MDGASQTKINPHLREASSSAPLLFLRHARAHPHCRGASALILWTLRRCKGASPLTWGQLTGNPLTIKVDGCIPTHMGPAL